MFTVHPLVPPFRAGIALIAGLQVRIRPPAICIVVPELVMMTFAQLKDRLRDLVSHLLGSPTRCCHYE